MDNLAIIASKLSARTIRAVGAGFGSNLPGRIARKVAPDILAKLVNQRRKGVLAISGTNGKSTTSGFVYSILRHAGLKTVHNRQGANLITGITATVLDTANWNGKLDTDYCLFEIDEASLPVVASEINISAVLVTNLFRDQLDRFGELDTTAKLINKGILIHGSQAILNADDPNVAQLAPNCPKLFYGIESIVSNDSSTNHTGTVELSYCPQCNKEYTYEKVFYGQLGHYQCLACQYTSPVPLIQAHNITLTPTNSSFTLQVPNDSITITVNLPGLFNVYNALAAAALAYWLQIPIITIKEGITHYSTLFGRSERITIKGKPVIIQLIKNPAGASQVVSSVARDTSARILIAINDNLADGRDISWLWDTDFELLQTHQYPIYISGQRADDMAMRMKYAGCAQNQIVPIPSLQKALFEAIEAIDPGQTLWILPTYTCLLDLQKILKTQGYRLSDT